MRYPMLKAAAALAAGLLVLAACSRSEPEQPPEADNMAEATPVEDVTPIAPPSAEPAPVANAVDANAVAIAPPPEAPTEPDAQMLEDADATGMTARVSRDEAPAGNDQADQ